ECATGRFEIPVPVKAVRLEMAAHAPFVPGIDEHERLWRAACYGPIDGLAEPPLVRLRGGAVKDRGIAPPSGRVVPAGEDSFVAEVRYRRWIGQDRPRLLVVVDVEPVEVAEGEPWRRGQQ